MKIIKKITNPYNGEDNNDDTYTVLFEGKLKFDISKYIELSVALSCSNTHSPGSLSLSSPNSLTHIPYI